MAPELLKMDVTLHRNTKIMLKSILFTSCGLDFWNNIFLSILTFTDQPDYKYLTVTHISAF